MLHGRRSPEPVTTARGRRLDVRGRFRARDATGCHCLASIMLLTRGDYLRSLYRLSHHLRLGTRIETFLHRTVLLAIAIVLFLRDRLEVLPGIPFRHTCRFVRTARSSSPGIRQIPWLQTLREIILALRLGLPSSIEYGSACIKMSRLRLQTNCKMRGPRGIHRYSCLETGRIRISRNLDFHFLPLARPESW